MIIIDKELQSRFQKLQDILREMGSVAVAFSGGVDSTFLLRAAHTCLQEKALGIYYDSILMQQRERNQIDELVAQIGTRFLRIGTVDLSHEAFSKHPENRCYLCKGLIFDKLIDTAKREGFNHVVDGSNVDDQGDYRPGKMALQERGVRSPLLEAGLTKADIRQLSKEFGLPTWDKDALACLATRIPHGEAVTEDKLHKIDTLESLLVDRGFRDVRARLLPDEVVLEVRYDQVSSLEKFLKQNSNKQDMEDIAGVLLRINPDGYKRGNMNTHFDPKVFAI